MPVAPSRPGAPQACFAVESLLNELADRLQMDPIELIDIKGDSTFALLLEAQRRGHDVFYYTPPNLSLKDGRLIAFTAMFGHQSDIGAQSDL